VKWLDQSLATIQVTTHIPDEQKLLPNYTKKKKDELSGFHKRSILTGAGALVGDVIANFCGYRGLAWSAQRVLTAVKFGFLYRNHYFSFE
jgi:hypothetical protein